MAKIGLEIKIDLTKIEKQRIYQGKKGKYLTMTTFVDLDQQDDYGNNGMVTHKKEQDETGKPPILGNSKIFWKTDEKPKDMQSLSQQVSEGFASTAIDEDDLPF